MINFQKSDVLLKTNLIGVDQQKCESDFKVFENNADDLIRGIIDSQFCAEHKRKQADTCQVCLI